MGFGITLGLLLVVMLILAVRESLKPEPKPRAYKPTCPAPRYKSKEEELLVKIRMIKEATIRNNYSRALVLLEEVDVIINTSITINSIDNIIPVNSGELKE